MIDCLNIETYVTEITRSTRRENLRKHKWYLTYESSLLGKFLRQRELQKILDKHQRRHNEIIKLKSLLNEYSQNIERGHL